MLQKSNNYINSTIFLPVAYMSGFKISRPIAFIGNKTITISLSQRNWKVLTVIVCKLGRPLSNIVETIENLREGSFENALAAYLQAYEQDWFENEPETYVLHFPDADRSSLN